jgi:hypothetical protein
VGADQREGGDGEWICWSKGVGLAFGSGVGALLLHCGPRICACCIAWR